MPGHGNAPILRCFWNDLHTITNRQGRAVAVVIGWNEIERKTRQGRSYCRKLVYAQAPDGTLISAWTKGEAEQSQPMRFRMVSRLPPKLTFTVEAIEREAQARRIRQALERLAQRLAHDSPDLLPLVYRYLLEAGYLPDEIGTLLSTATLEEEGAFHERASQALVTLHDPVPAFRDL